MKTAGGIGILIIAGLIIWWLIQSKQARAAGLLPGQTYPAQVGETEYEKLHTTVPITRYVEKEMPVYQTIEELEANHG